MTSPEEMLMFMVYNGDYESVEILLKGKVNLNYQDRQGVTPLLGATEKGDYKMAKLLLENGADCNGRGRLTEMHYAMGIPRQSSVLEWTPLINAALYGHSKIVELLINHGADINFRDINGRSALNSALQQSHQKCVEVLILSGAEVSPVDFATASFMCPNIDIAKLLNDGKKPKKRETKKQNVPVLHPAALDGDRERLRDLIKKGADVNLIDSTGRSALHIVIENGYLRCAEFLIKKGADVNIKDKDKCTALHRAASHGFSDFIPLLVNSGANIDACGDEGITPLHCAIFHCNPMCVKQLLNHGANVNATFSDGKTALHIAVTKSPDCIELLLKENANVFVKDDMGICPLELAIELGPNTFKTLCAGNYNIKSSDGITLLHIAARCYKTECLEILINEGCDVNVVSRSGDTPLHFTCSQTGFVNNMLHAVTDNIDFMNIEFLIKAGADINKTNNMGLSPIHVCVKNGLFSQMRALNKFGAKLNSPCENKKQTPLHYAAEIGSLPCIKYLLENGVDKIAVNTENCTALMIAARNSHFVCVKFLLENDVPLWVP